MNQFQANLILLITALIWGFGFVAQRMGMDHLGPYSFNVCRFLVGALSLLPLLFFLRKKESGSTELNPSFWKFSIFAGFALFGGATLQQVGIQYTTVGKAGFITGLYVVIVPIIGFSLRQKIGKWTVYGCLLAVIGLYLLSAKEDFSMGWGESLVLMGAFFWAIHVQVIGSATKHNLDPLKLALVQYLVCAGLNLILSLSLETFTLDRVMLASGAIAYAGVVSVGIAFTLQVVAQKKVDPSRAAIILNLEAVFAVLAGWLFFTEVLSTKEWVGCGLMFLGMILSQIPTRKKQ
ncbi:DMT family transporter [Opitutales bacterium]|nr:DMT family transporter [Opitutales bacterium]